jgi:ribosomal protein L30E
MAFETTKPKEEIVGLALQTAMEELTEEETKLQIIATVIESQRNNAIEYFAANNIKVVVEVTPVFILESSKEDIHFLSKEQFIKKLDMPSVYKLTKGIK